MGVARGCGLAEDVQLAMLDIQHPIFNNSGLGVAGCP